MKLPYDLTGKRFGKLTTIKNSGKRTPSGRHIYWLCQCDCGKTKLVTANNLTTGHTQSCGCLHTEATRKMGRANTIHGDARGKIRGIYLTWVSMRHRCYSPKNASYKYYGKRGIIICDEWKDSYKVFKKWALSNGYRPGLTIDRIDPKGSYEPSNCQWLTKSENSRKCQLQLRGIYDCF